MIKIGKDFLWVWNNLSEYDNTKWSHFWMGDTTKKNIFRLFFLFLYDRTDAYSPF